MIRVIALTGYWRSEVVILRCGEVDIEGSCLRLGDAFRISAWPNLI
ncbi:hypothetical protein NKI20_06910 [Mesorhizobium sp. M0830]